MLTAKAVTETTTDANVFSTEPAWSNIKLIPKHVRVSIEISRTLIEQSSRDINDLILNDMRSALTEELDRQILKGNSTQNEISGIVNTSGISSATWTPHPALQGGTAHESVRDAEGNLGTGKTPLPYFFIMNSNTRKRLRSIRLPSFFTPIFMDDGKMLGYDALITENLEDADCWLMNPSFVVVGLWHDSTVFDLIIDGFTRSINNKVVLTMSVMADAALVKPNALSVISQ